MATSTVDLSSLQTVNFGNGVTGYYDPGSGNYFDSGGNVLSASDLAQYGAFTVGAPGTTPLSPPLPSSAPVNPSGSGGALSGLSGIFSGIGAAIISATRPSTVTTPQGQTLVYNPATGGYTTTTAINASSSMSMFVMLAIAGVVLYFVFREAKGR